MIFDDNEEEFGLDFNELEGFEVRNVTPPATLWGPQAEPALFPRGMYAKHGQLAAAGKLIAAGFSCRQVASMTGACKNTVTKLRKVLAQVADIHPVCECGRPSTHQGWCRPRYLKSAARQAFIKRWTQSPKLPRLPA